MKTTEYILYGVAVILIMFLVLFLRVEIGDPQAVWLACDLMRLCEHGAL